MIKIRCDAFKAIRQLAVMGIIIAIAALQSSWNPVTARAQSINDVLEQETWRASLDSSSGIYAFKNSLHDLEIVITPAEISNESPNLVISKWNNDAGFKIALPVSDSLIDITTAAGTSKLRLSGNNSENLFYVKSANDFEWEIILNEKPASNVLTYSFESDNLRFFYQDPDTFEVHKNDWEFGVDIPGSYALYHSSGKHNQFKTGKAFHIYRPRVWNGNGDTVWCDLYIDTVSNALSISIPSSFLADSKYPIVVDPTFGCTTKGAVGLSIGTHNFRHLVNYNDYSEADGDMQTAYICGYKNTSSAACTTTAAVYSYSSTLGNCQKISTSNKIEITKFAVSPDSAAWFSTPISGTLEDNEDYMVSWQGKESCDYCLRICADYTGIWGYERYADYSAWGTNDNLAGYSSGSYICSVYIEYDEGGGPANDPYIRTRKLKRSN